MLRAVAMVWLLTLGTSCALTADRTPSTPLSPPNASPADTPGPGGAPTATLPSLTSTTDTQTPGLPSRVAIRLDGRTQVWNGDTQVYETAAEFTRDAQLFMVTKDIGGGTAFAILSGELFEEKAGAILFATNTAALRDIPAISRNLVTASIDVAVEGADFVGGAQPLNRYLASITSR
jgi:hypothetical protein